jgi:ceramide glucosyltransferase
MGFSVVAASLAVAGLVQALLGAVLVRRFARQARRSRPMPRRDLPWITVLKPLHGDEPMLAAALESLCRQDYPHYQIVFGVQDPADPARLVAERLAARYRQLDIAVVVDPMQHGANRKIGNLINMFPSARHDVLVIADSDLHVRPDYLRRLVAALEQPGIGLVTTLYAGLPASGRLAARLGALQITEIFLPGALMARALGRRDCLGATMMLRRATLERIGGLNSLADHLADDHVLGALARSLGLGIALARTVPVTTVPETAIGPLFRHELRWGRTIRALVPVSFLLSALQYPLAWATLAFLLAPSGRAFGLFALAWACRAATAHASSDALRRLLGPLARRPALWLLPARDLLSVAVMVASFAGRRVEWRGHAMAAGGPVRIQAGGPVPHPAVVLSAGLSDAAAASSYEVVQ